MDQKIKRKWVKALRSGKYKQAEGMLRDPDDGSMCCLGVLCHIQGADPNRLNGMVTAKVPEKFNSGLTMVEREQLAAMNDGAYCAYVAREFKKRTFRGIAQWIERHL